MCDLASRCCSTRPRLRRTSARRCAISGVSWPSTGSRSAVWAADCAGTAPTSTRGSRRPVRRRSDLILGSGGRDDPRPDSVSEQPTDLAGSFPPFGAEARAALGELLRTVGIVAPLWVTPDGVVHPPDVDARIGAHPAASLAGGRRLHPAQRVQLTVQFAVERAQLADAAHRARWRRSTRGRSSAIWPRQARVIKTHRVRAWSARMVAPPSPRGARQRYAQAASSRWPVSLCRSRLPRQGC